ASAVILPVGLHASIVPSMQVVTIMAAAWLAFVLGAVGWQRRSGWVALLSTMPLVYPLVIFDVMQNTGLRFAFVPLGVGAFIVAPVAVLARRLARALNLEELRSREERGRASELGLALRKQTKFANDVMESVPVAISLRDVDGKYLFVNHAWETWFGEG